MAKLDTAVPASSRPHLVKSVRVQKDPAELDNLSRVLRNVYAMLVTGGGNVDDHVSIDFQGWALLCCHDCN